MIKDKSFIAKKSLGQNFLVNHKIVDRIIDACHLTLTDRIIEIGPGKGALTGPISRRVNTMIAVEKDGRLAETLQNQFNNSNVHVIHQDFLSYPLTMLTGKMTVVGNLPYNMATPIIEKIIHFRKLFRAFYMTVQLEYAQRMTAKPDSKNRSSWGCYVQYFSDPKILFKIRNTAFQPVPKVQSCFLSMNFLEKPRYETTNQQLLFAIIRSCFQQRRKMLRNSLTGILDQNMVSRVLKLSKIDPTCRAQNIDLKGYVTLANAADQLGASNVLKEKSGK